MATLMVAMSVTGKPAGEGTITLMLDHYAGDKVLQLDTVQYKNELGQAYTVTKFKYYISNIYLEKANEEEPASKTIHLNNVPPGEYSGIKFIIGVDSLHNCSGAQSGALDPVNAMFWAWNTGYIFMKLEGRSPASTSPGNIFEFHIGGYKKPANCIRTVMLNFDKHLIIGPSTTREVHIKADIAAILKSHTVIDFSKLSSVTDFHNATIIADNYEDMFSVLSEQ